MMTSPRASEADLQSILTRLFARKTFGIKLGLEPITQLLERIGSPHRDLRFVHVAGTNGKGSVSAMIASILQEAGYRVGLYASPHLVDFRERMRVAGEPITTTELAGYAAEMMPHIEETGCTFFEGTTAIAFRYFAENACDVVVLETGMGGRLDATNVVTPLVSVITSIGLDHTRHLGTTYEEIAAEKGGIIKEDVPAVVGPIRPRLQKVFDAIAREKGTVVTYVEKSVRSIHHQTTLQRSVATFMTPQGELSKVSLDLPGKHQVANARVAIAAIEALPSDLPVSREAIVRGLGHVRGRTGIAGRLHLLPGAPDILLEVAHNPDGVRVLVDFLDHAVEKGRRVTALFGAVREKSTDEVMEILAPKVDRIWAVSADSERSLPSDDIAHAAELCGIATEDLGSVDAGLRRALEVSGQGDLLLVLGSFFVVGEAIATLREVGRLGDLSGPFGVMSVEEKRERYGEEFVEAPEQAPSEPAPSEPEERGGERANHDANGRKHRSVREWAPSEQPRERLRALGASALSDAELLAILLRTGTKSRDVVAVARDLLHTFTTRVTEDRLIDITGRALNELETIDGIGPVKAVTLAAAFELGNRVVARSFSERPVIGNPQNVAGYFIPRFRALKKEEFHVVLLNSAGRIIRYDRVSEGNLNSSIVHPREVFRAAIVEGAASIIGLHNHPSGNPEPSREDLAITRQLVEAGNLLGIPLRDHIIIAGEEYTSLAERGVI